MPIIFLQYMCKTISLFKWWYGQLSLKLLFCDIFGMIFNIDFKFGSINFHQQRKQPAKYQHMSIEKQCTVNLFLILTLAKTWANPTQIVVSVPLSDVFLRDNPAGNYMFKVNNRNTRTRSLTSFWCLYC